jgi:hypothetical protein
VAECKRNGNDEGHKMMGKEIRRKKGGKARDFIKVK